MTLEAIEREAAAATGPARLLRDWIDRHARERPDKAFVESIDQGKRITYGELATAADRIAHALAARGIGRNDRVALLSNNSIEHLVTFIATMAYGATCCTIHVEMNAVYFEDILKAVNARLVLWEDGLGLERLAGAVPGEWLPLGEWQGDTGTGWFAEVARQPAGNPPSAGARPDDVAEIVYTSGTSARPKGVVLTFSELEPNIEPTAAMFGLCEADRFLDYRSYNWVSAQWLSCLGVLCRGATLVMGRRFSQSRLFEWIRDHKATIAAGNPTIINMMINRPVDIRAADVPHLRYLTSSSAPLMVPEWQRFEAMYGIRIVQGMGMSEIGWICGADEATRRFGTVGRPLPYLKLRIVDAEGNPLPPGETGSIELGHHPDNAYKYLGDDGSVLVVARGRMKTGDIGTLDEDGYLRITGREKDLIIRGGVNIAPAEIDTILLEMPGVAEAATVGVPDPIYGEEVVAFVAPKPGAALTEDTVIAFCAGRLPAARCPKRIFFKDALPKTDRGKMDRNALRQALPK